MKYVIQNTVNPNFLVSLDNVPEWDANLSKAMEFDSLEAVKKWRKGLNIAERAFLMNTRVVPKNKSYH